MERMWQKRWYIMDIRTSKFRAWNGNYGRWDEAQDFTSRAVALETMKAQADSEFLALFLMDS